MKSIRNALIGPLVLGGLFCACPSWEVFAQSSLYKEDASKLALYEANDEPWVVLAVAGRPRTGKRIEKLVASVGGRVDYVLEDIDYVTAVVRRESVRIIAAHSDVQVLAVDNLSEEYAYQVGWMSQGDANKLQGSVPADGAEEALDWPPRPSARPLEKLYSILSDMNGEEFRALNPKYDGRGVVIAHVEGFPDFLSPELQLAKDATGNDLPQFADIVNIPVPQSGSDSRAARGPMWTTRLSEVIESDGNDLSYFEARYRVPAKGAYRLATFEVPHPAVALWSGPTYDILQRAYFPELGGESMTGATEPPALRFDVLWSDSRRMLWIDTNRNKSFADETGIEEYQVSHQIGVLGIDDPSTSIRESIGYTVQSDGDYLSINLGNDGHATMVAGAAAASRGIKGRIDGIAPSAQLIAIAGGTASSISAYVRAMATAFTDPRTDVVLLEGHSQIVMPHAPKDAGSLLAVILSRLVDRYGKPTLVTANNTPFMSAVFDFTLPQNVLSIGASQSAASVWAHYGVRTRYPQDLHWVGSEGPAGNGALKPDLLAPANPLSVAPMTSAGSYHGGIFQLPPGYTIGSGTSTAAPVAAGATALLVGAAKLNGLPYDANRVSEALRKSAKFIPEIAAYKQGRGVLQLNAAWKHLSASTTTENDGSILVSAPVRTAWSDALPESNSGVGLFEREGWRVGTRKTRVISLTRQTGSKSPVVMRVNWLGNSGVFSSADSIALPLNVPTPLEIVAAPDAPGVYSAILQLSGDDGDALDVSIPVTIVVPIQFEESNAHAWSGVVTLDRPGRENLFFHVPAEARALSIEVTAPRDLVAWLVNPENPDEIQRGLVFGRAGGKQRVTVEAPAPGVWELALNDRADSSEHDWSVDPAQYLPPTDIGVKAVLYRTSLEQEGNVVHVLNTGAEFEGGVSTTSLAGMRSETFKLSTGAMRAFDIEVEPGQEMLVVEAAKLSGDSLDADLYLFDCTQGRCWSAYRADHRHSNERVIVERPAAGKWKAVVVVTGSRSGQVEMSFTDYYAHPGLGALVSADDIRGRSPKDAWSAGLYWSRVGHLRPGYKLCGPIVVKAHGARLASVRSYVPAYLSRKEGEGRDALLEFTCVADVH